MNGSSLREKKKHILKKTWMKVAREKKDRPKMAWIMVRIDLKQ